MVETKPDQPAGLHVTITDAVEDEVRAAEYALSLLPIVADGAAWRRVMVDDALAAGVTKWHMSFRRNRRRGRSLYTVRQGQTQDRSAPVLCRKILLVLQQSWILARSQPRIPVVVAAMAVFIKMPEAPHITTDAPLCITDISDQNGSIRIFAVLNSETGTLHVERRSGTVGNGRIFEIWAIDARAASVSFKVFPVTAKAHFDMHLRYGRIWI